MLNNNRNVRWLLVVSGFLVLLGTRLWYTTTGVPTYSTSHATELVTTEGGRVTSIAVSEDGNYVGVTASPGMTFSQLSFSTKVWRADNDQFINHILHDDGVTTIVPTSHIPSGFVIGSTPLVEIDCELRSSTEIPRSYADLLAVSNTGRDIAATSGPWIQSYDLIRGLVTRVHSGTKLTAIAFGSTPSLVITGSATGTLQLWSFPQLNLIASCKTHKGPISALIPLGDDSIMSCSHDCFVKKWSIRNNQFSLITEVDVERPVTAMTFLAKRKMICIGVGTVDFYSLETDKLVSRFAGGSTDIVGMAITRDEQWLFTASRRTVLKWNLNHLLSPA